MNRLLKLLIVPTLVGGCGDSGREATLEQIDRESLDPAQGILLIVIDTLRADHLGIYNPDKPFSPALDAFAGEGVVFDAMYAASPWTRSSIASIFTSRYPMELNVQTKKDVLVDSVLTLAEVFSENEYQTHGINTNANAGALFGFDQGFDHYDEPETGDQAQADSDVLYPARQVTESVLQFLNHRETNRPLFMGLS